jgi:hypothetical protein
MKILAKIPELTIDKIEKNRCFESVDEAIEYCRKFGDCSLQAAKILVVANMEMSEYGFAGELCKEAELLEQ